MRYIVGILLLLFVTSLWGVWFFWLKPPNGQPHHHYFHKPVEMEHPQHRHFYEYRRVVKPSQESSKN